MEPPLSKRILFWNVVFAQNLGKCSFLSLLYSNKNWRPLHANYWCLLEAQKAVKQATRNLLKGANGSFALISTHLFSKKLSQFLWIHSQSKKEKDPGRPSQVSQATLDGLEVLGPKSLSRRALDPLGGRAVKVTISFSTVFGALGIEVAIQWTIFSVTRFRGLTILPSSRDPKRRGGSELISSSLPS